MLLSKLWTRFLEEQEEQQGKQKDEKGKKKR